MENKKFVVSFGDSTRYIVNFDGDRDAFIQSEKLADIKRRVDDFLKKEFPTGGYEAVIEMNVADDDGRTYPVLDETGFGELLKSVKRQVEVAREDTELNNNAPFDNH